MLSYSLAYAFGPPILTVLLGHVGGGASWRWPSCVCGVALAIALSPFFSWAVIARTLLAVAAWVV